MTVGLELVRDIKGIASVKECRGVARCNSGFERLNDESYMGGLLGYLGGV